MHSFDWRLSIAKVDENGVFSNFSGYQRNLILLSGNGIRLQHKPSPSEKIRVDVLDDPLSFATFDGGWKTEGLLKEGVITDFNLMHNPKKIGVRVNICKNQQDRVLAKADLCFVYSLIEEARLTSIDQSVDIVLKPRHLLQITSVNDNESQLHLSGNNLIVLYLQQLV